MGQMLQAFVGKEIKQGYLVWAPSPHLGSMNEGVLLGLCSRHTLYHPPTCVPSKFRMSPDELISLFFSKL